MNIKHLLVFIGLSLAAAPMGCAEEAPPPEESDDDLTFGKGTVDQAGIVESTTMMLAALPTSSQLDQYNREDPFKIAGTSYRATFADRLAQFDRADGHVDWKPEASAAWADRMAAANYLVIDVSKPCSFDGHNYLEIERATMTGRAHTTCGGRVPNEDAMDTTINFLVRGPGASVLDSNALGDGVDQATQKASDTFPYLADMN
jgi:hypothetical protein